MGRTVSSTLAAASEPLTHNLILASFIDITLVDVLLVGPLVLLIGSMMSPLLNVIRMSMSTIFFFTNVDSGYFFVQNALI